MLTLASYQGVVENGVVRLKGATLPDGTKVLVVAVESRLAPVDEQVRRLRAIPDEEWRKPFDELVEFAQEHPAEVDIDTISDEELNAIVHEVRAEQMRLK